MIDLTKIDKPFGDLDQVTQWALKGAAADGNSVEYSGSRGDFWHSAFNPQWCRDWFYRLKPTPVKTQRTWTVGASAFDMDQGQPTLCIGNVNNPQFTKGDVTVDFVDGEPVRIVWEKAT